MNSGTGGGRNQCIRDLDPTRRDLPIRQIDVLNLSSVTFYEVGAHFSPKKHKDGKVYHQKHWFTVYFES